MKRTLPRIRRASRLARDLRFLIAPSSGAGWLELVTGAQPSTITGSAKLSNFHTFGRVIDLSETSGDKIDYGQLQIGSTTTPFTIGLLYYQTGYGPSNFPILSSYYVGDATNHLAIGASNSGTWRPWWFGSRAGWLTMEVSGNPFAGPTGRWVSLVWTYNGNGSSTLSNHNLYLDGVLQTLQAGTSWGAMSPANVTGMGNTTFPTESEYALNIAAETEWSAAEARLFYERPFDALESSRVFFLPLAATPAAGGAIDQTVSPGTLPITGQSVGLGLTVDQTVSPGTLPIVGQSVGFGLTVDQTVNPGTLPITGQVVGFALTTDFNQTVVPGTLPITGQTVALTLTTDQTVVPGTLPLVGQTVVLSLGADVNQTVNPGTLPIVGQTVGFALDFDQTVIPGTVPITGQSVPLTLTIDQTVNPGTLPITGQSVGYFLGGALNHLVNPGTLPIVGQTVTLHLKTIQGTLLEIIEEDLGAAFFECTGTGFATDFIHSGTTYCGIFTAEATDISERRNAFIETETSNTSVMSRGDVIEVIATPLNAGGTFTIRGLSPDGTGQSQIILDNV